MKYLCCRCHLLKALKDSVYCLDCRNEYAKEYYHGYRGRGNKRIYIKSKDKSK